MIPSRRHLLAGLGASLATGPALTQATATGLKLSEAQIAAGRALLNRHPSVDVHAHPGLFIVRDPEHPDAPPSALGPPHEAKALRAMAQGRVTAALFNCVSDQALIKPTPTGISITREFQPGEAWAEYRRQIGLLRAMLARHDVAPGRSVADIAAAQAARNVAAVFAVEGGDFIEDRMERVHAAYGDGVRSITIIHYHPNQIGDPQTSAPRFPGLTDIGKDVVREMNRTGIIVDLAHASFGVVRDAVGISTRPMMLSHTNLKRPDLDNPRLVSLEHARLVTEPGGIVGSWPSGVGHKTMADWIDSILRLVDALGVDHVAIGTDMDANYMPVFTDYADWPLIPAALLARGLHEAEVAKIMGGNFLRLLAGRETVKPDRAHI
ncbi:MAG: dipeptidase [Phenylobacterium sp.]